MKKIDVKLLFKVLGINTSSYKDGKILAFLIKWLNEHNFTYTRDTFGNLYVQKGKPEPGFYYPCIVSHVDTVHDWKNEEYVQIKQSEEVLYAWDNLVKQQVGIGGDDLCGVFICLEALKTLPIVKVAFFRQEEIGCLGSEAADLNFFKDCGYIIQPDRLGNDDFSIEMAGLKVASQEFKATVKPVLEKFDYSFAKTSTTDVRTLVKRGVGISVTNISSGYYRPHTSTEVVNIDDVNTAFNLVLELSSVLGYNKYEHIYTPPVYKPTPWSPVTKYVGPSFTAVQTGTKVKELLKTQILYDPMCVLTPVKMGSFEVVDNYYYKTKETFLRVLGETSNFHLNLKNGEIYNARTKTYITKPNICRMCRKKARLELYTVKFVYNYWYNSWIPEELAKWSDVYETYLSITEYNNLHNTFESETKVL